MAFGVKVGPLRISSWNAHSYSLQPLEKLKQRTFPVLSWRLKQTQLMHSISTTMLYKARCKMIVRLSSSTTPASLLTYITILSTFSLIIAHHCELYFHLPIYWINGHCSWSLRMPRKYQAYLFQIIQTLNIQMEETRVDLGGRHQVTISGEWLPFLHDRGLWLVWLNPSPPKVNGIDCTQEAATIQGARDAAARLILSRLGYDPEYAAWY